MSEKEGPGYDAFYLGPAVFEIYVWPLKIVLLGKLIVVKIFVNILGAYAVYPDRYIDLRAMSSLAPTLRWLINISIKYKKYFTLPNIKFLRY